MKTWSCPLSIKGMSGFFKSIDFQSVHADASSSGGAVEKRSSPRTSMMEDDGRIYPFSECLFVVPLSWDSRDIGYLTARGVVTLVSFLARWTVIYTQPGCCLYWIWGREPNAQLSTYRIRKQVWEILYLWEVKKYFSSFYTSGFLCLATLCVKYGTFGYVVAVTASHAPTYEGWFF